MTIQNNKDCSFEELQSSLEDLGFQYEKGNFTKTEMLNLVNKCCKTFLFNSDQEEIINDGLMELAEHPKGKLQIIGEIKDILDGEQSNG